MTSLRIFFVGGLISFRALFSFLRPEVYIPSMLIAPIFQILLFVYIGRSADLESDEFFVIGNAVQYAAIPCLFAMTFTIGGERNQHTLGYILVSPAPRLPLFLGRALPVVVNGFFVAAFSLVVGGLIVGIHVPASSYAPLALATLICAFSCTGLGLAGAGIGLVMREQAVLANIMFGVLLIFTGANVAVDQLPGWMQSISNVLPFTHGIEAAREVADGASLSAVADLLAVEVALGLVYGALGYAFIRGAERLSLRWATLDRA
ncbi:MAG TPA: ABC transporter permease [Gaiella sp.]|nr:ABC transporter permease [Gaiella sp.]